MGIVILIIIIVIAAVVAKKYFSAKKQKETELESKQKSNDDMVQSTIESSKASQGSKTQWDSNFEIANKFFIAKEYTLNKEGFWPTSWNVSAKWKITKGQFDEAITAIIGNRGTKEYALNRCDLDESEVAEVDSVQLKGFLPGSNRWANFDNERKGDYTDQYGYAWIFCTDDTFDSFTLVIDLLKGRVSENSDRLFYQDIISYKVVSDTDYDMDLFQVKTAADEQIYRVESADQVSQIRSKISEKKKTRK